MCINWDTKFGLFLEYDDLQFFFLADIEHNPCIDNLTLNYFDSNNYNLKSSYGLLCKIHDENYQALLLFPV